MGFNKQKICDYEMYNIINYITSFINLIELLKLL